MLRNAAIALGVSAMAQQGIAACPTRSDLDIGIVLVQNAPSFVRSDYERAARGLFYRSEMRLGQSSFVEAGFLDHVFAPSEVSLGGDVERTVYHSDPAVFDHLDQLGQHRITGVRTRADGSTAPHYVDARFAGTARATLAECIYDVWQVELTQPDGAGRDMIAQVEYAPDLGLVLAVTLMGGNRPQQLVRYQWIGTGADVAR